MKKVTAVLVAMAMVVSMVSLVFAEDAAKGTMMKGTVKYVNVKDGKLELKNEGGKEEALTVDKSVDLGAVKRKDEVEVSVVNGVVMGLKVTKKARAAMGC